MDIGRASARLKHRWPGRQAQISFLLGALAAEAPASLFLWGPPSAGKTSIVRDVLRELRRVHAYADCVESGKPRAVLQSLLTQLRGKKRKAETGYGGDCRCESGAEFLVQLPAVAPSKVSAQAIVLDNVQRIAGSDLLALLLRLPELSGANISVLVVSQVAWGAGAFELDTLRAPCPVQLHFPAYSEETLAKIMALDCPEDVPVQAYVRFLMTFLPTFARVSNRVEDLKVAVQQLWQLYTRPLQEGRLELQSTQALFREVAPHVQGLVARMAAGSANNLCGVSAGSVDPGQPATGPSVGAAATNISRKPNQLDFELPYNSKLLLLAAFVASRNRPALDQRLFQKGRGTRRRADAKASDKQAEDAKEMQQKGPCSFPLERLLCYFWNMLRAEGMAEGGDETEAAQEEQQSAEVFMLLRSLVSLRLMTQVSGDPLTDGRFRCDITEELAQTLARNVRLDLRTYLLYA